MRVRPALRSWRWQRLSSTLISDATGATAKRLVQALEAQFPDQEFEDIVHRGVETVDDLRLAVDRAKGRPAVILHACDQSSGGDARPLQERPASTTATSSATRSTPSRGCRASPRRRPEPAAPGLELLQANGGDRVRGQVRRRRQESWRMRTSSSSASRALRRRRSRSISATSATAPRTSRW